MALQRDWISDMRKSADTRTPSADIFMDCRNFMLGALNFSLIRFSKLIYYGAFTYKAKYINSHFNQIEGIFSNKPSKLQKWKTQNLRKFQMT